MKVDILNYVYVYYLLRIIFNVKHVYNANNIRNKYIPYFITLNFAVISYEAWW